MKIILTSNGETIPTTLQTKYLAAKNIPFVVYIYDFWEKTYTRAESPDIEELSCCDILALKDFGEKIDEEVVLSSLDDFFMPEFLTDEYRFDEVLIKVLEDEEGDICRKYRMNVVDIPKGKRAFIVDYHSEDDEDEEELVLEDEITWIVG